MYISRQIYEITSNLITQRTYKAIKNDNLYN